jgi:caffeoyl-CoA O-methyltransferase
VLATLSGPYDVAFIDADKHSYPAYARMALERLRPGGIVIADNAIRNGRIALAAQGEDNEGIRGLHDLLAGDPDLVATAVPVGDGLAIAVKRG